METYVILRRGGWQTSEEHQDAAVRSTLVGERMQDDVAWIRSYVSRNATAQSEPLCVYQAVGP